MALGAQLVGELTNRTSAQRRRWQVWQVLQGPFRSPFVVALPMSISSSLREKIKEQLRLNAESNAGGDLQLYLATKYQTDAQRTALKSNMEQLFQNHSHPLAEMTQKWCQAH